MNKTTVIASSVAAVALSGLVGVGVATADPPPSPTPSASPSGSPSSPAKDARADKKAERAKKQAERADRTGKRHRPLMGRALHGEATVGAKKQRVVHFQRGTVEKVSATSITVKSVDGFVATYVVNADTKIRENRKDAALSAIVPADRVRVMGLADGKAITAKRIAERPKR